jgi:hypothetical protein
MSLRDAFEDASRRKAILEARVQELAWQLEEQGDEPDARPRLRDEEALLYYSDFDRLLQRTGMGAVNLDYVAVREWAKDHDQDLDLAKEILYGLLASYRSISDELTQS